ncbi:MAG: hypothetical protein JSU70_06700 [Phycisphaerales bacterium]|nr:MAG: hypothetical protein JSU70_06700 [Phycisphaerales bacterium]
MTDKDANPIATTRRVYGTQHVFPDRSRRGLGWLRDVPDLRDTTLRSVRPKIHEDKDARELYSKVTKVITGAIRAKKGSSLPKKIDHRDSCSPIEDQGNLGSCTANACAGMVEYMERRAAGRHIDASRLFMYKVTRNLLGWQGDTGAFLRTTMQALVLFGMPPEEWWPYDISTFDYEPEAFLYAYAANYKALQYLRLDPPGLSSNEVLDYLKAAIRVGYAIMFGFSTYSSLGWDADIPYPGPMDTLDGGHAVLTVGYDDGHKFDGGSQGALLIRNSWGKDWGDRGYGWLPYDYVLDGLATDFWTCFRFDWVDSRHFE